MAENTEAVTENAAPQQAFPLTIGDIEQVVHELEFACGEGIYKGVERMISVLVLRERLLNFMRSVMQATPIPEISPEINPAEVGS